MAGRYFSLRMHPVPVRERVGAPLSLASIARDLQVSPATIAKYLDILEALYIVFTVRPSSVRSMMPRPAEEPVSMRVWGRFSLVPI